jgi:hypothetical protein
MRRWSDWQNEKAKGRNQLCAGLVLALAVAVKLISRRELCAAFRAVHASNRLLRKAHFGVAGAGVGIPVMPVKLVAR